MTCSASAKLAESKLMNVGKIVQKTLLATIIVVFILAPLVVRSLYESSQALIVGTQAQTEGRISAAIDGYAEALRWRGPFNVYATQAHSKLRELSERLGGQDRVYALNKLRQSLYVSRSILFFGIQSSAELTEITSQLEQAGARITGAPDDGGPFEPSYRYQLVAQLGFWGFIVAMIVLIWRSFSADGKLLAGNFLRYLPAVIGAFALWIVGLVLA